MEEILEDLENGLTYDDFDENYDLSRHQAHSLIEELREEGYSIGESIINKHGKRQFILEEEPDLISSKHIIEPKNHYKFALTSDWHIGAKATHYDYIKEYLEDCDKEDIDFIAHAGDLLDGFKVYQGQTQELAPGMTSIDGQIEEASKIDLPTTMYIISGNHEDKTKKKQGIEVLKILEGQHEDIEYLGEFNEELDLNDISLELIHPTGRSAYAKSYKAQKQLRNREPDDIPDILGMGHTHDLAYNLIQGCSAFQTGTFMGENNLSKRMAVETIPAGWIIDIEIDEAEEEWEDNEVKTIIPKLLRYDK